MTTKTKPPTDEVMCKIMAKKKMWRDGCSYHFAHSKPFIQHGNKERAADPRVDSDAADELLHWVISEHFISYYWVSAGWVVQCGHQDFTIPISGDGKRTAICNLAAKIICKS